ncbi:MAG: VCBS repeat-containing protein, partial [Bacteroidota bacterium]
FNQIGWFKNEGGGSFSFGANICENTAGAVCIHAADLDGDGDQDVISASKNDTRVLWHVNAGGANFTGEKLISTTAASPSFIDLMDVDGDGDLDAVSADAGARLLAWYENQGGAFGRQQLLFDGMLTDGSFSHGDLDGDGDEDLVAAASPNLVILENQGSGNFTLLAADPALQPTHSVQLQDMDGDGDLDLFAGIGDDFSQALVWYENTGVGVLSAVQHPIAGYSSISALKLADFDGDGDPDVFKASSADAKISRFKNNGDGTFQAEETVVTGYNFSGLDVADVDFDGNLDLAASTANEVIWYENQGGQGSLSAAKIVAQEPGLAPAYLTVADLDADGRPDVLSGSNSLGGIQWNGQTGQGDFTGFNFILPNLSTPTLHSKPVARDF